MTGLFYIPPCIDIKAAMIAVYVFAAIAAIEAGIIGRLATRVGSLRKLFRLTSSVADKESHSAGEETHKATEHSED